MLFKFGMADCKPILTPLDRNVRKGVPPDGKGRAMLMRNLAEAETENV